MNRNCSNVTTAASAPITTTIPYNDNILIGEPNIKSTRDSINKKLFGWICPVCGRGVSPYNSYCDCNYSAVNEQIDTTSATIDMPNI